MNQTRREKTAKKMTILTLLMLVTSSGAFITSQTSINIGLGSAKFISSNCRHSFVAMKSTPNDTDTEAEINKMRVKEIRDELESYGISTKSFFEKSELAEALLAARKEGKTPIKDDSETSASSTSSSTETNTSSPGNRQERLREEMEKCKSMKVADLKKELESYGISTKSYFEKSEFVVAVAEARVDGIKKQPGGSSGGQQREEPRDPSFRDVVVTKFGGDSKMGMGGSVIDVKAR